MSSQLSIKLALRSLAPSTARAWRPSTAARRRTVCLAAVAFVGAPAVAQLGAPNWVPTFGDANGAEGHVAALAIVDLPGVQPPMLYVGGDFTGAGASGAKRIAAWDGARWRDPTPGLLQGAVNALIDHDDGSGRTLIAGGSFWYTNTHGESLRRVAKWSNGEWRAMGGGLSNTVVDFAVFDAGAGPRLFAAGVFQLGTVRYVASWDGSDWSSTNYPYGAASDLQVHDDGSGSKLYVAAGTRVSRWDGQVWEQVGPLFDSSVLTLAVHDDGAGPALYAGGNFTQSGTSAISGVAKWAGSQWASPGGVMGAGVHGLHSHDDGSGSKLYAVGTAIGGVARFDGAQWVPVGVHSPSFSARRLASFDAGDGRGSVLYVAGANGSIGAVFGKGVLAWDGSAWTPLGRGLDGFVNACGSFDDNGSGAAALFVGGTLNVIDGRSFQRIGRWDGSGWSDMNGGVGGLAAPFVDAFEVYDDGLGGGEALYVGGYFATAGGVPASSVARWNGVGWSALGAGVEGVAQCMEVYDSGAGPELYVGGFITSAGGAPASGLAKWNGVTWTSIPGGPSFFTLRDLAVFDSGSGAGPELIVAGSFQSVAGIASKNIARWNGTSWSAMFTGTSDTVFALVVHDDGSGPSLFVGGDFASAGAVQALNVARWDGSNWHALGAGLSDDVLSLASHDDGSGRSLYAGGRFTGSGATPMHAIARWNGAEWSALNSQPSMDAVQCFVEHDDGSGSGVALFVGGAFRASPARDSYLAKWGRDPRAVVTYCTSMTSSAGCVPQASAIGTAAVDATSGFTLTATNVDAQRNGLFFYGANGPIASPWGPGGLGWLCVKTPVQRMDLLSSGGTANSCNGVLSTDWSVYVAARPFALGRPFYVGQRFNAQAWYRDPAQPGGSMLTNGVEFGLQP